MLTKEDQTTLLRRHFKHSDKMICPHFNKEIKFTWGEKVSFNGEEIGIEVCEHCYTKKKYESGGQILREVIERRKNESGL